MPEIFQIIFALFILLSPQLLPGCWLKIKEEVLVLGLDFVFNARNFYHHLTLHRG